MANPIFPGWRAYAGGYALDVTSDLKPGEKDSILGGRAVQAARGKIDRDSPAAHCFPTLGPTVTSWLYKILQTPGVIAFLREAYGLFQPFVFDSTADSGLKIRTELAESGNDTVLIALGAHAAPW
jgi:hypothetical protein